MTLKPTAPTSEQQLLQRAHALAGLTLAELAAIAGIPVPASLHRDKGWVGQLLEWHLGATAGSRPEPDFPQLGIELKSLPITANGEPLETTFVCFAPLENIAGLRFEQSGVAVKLARVLWWPVEGERTIPIGERRVATPLLWSPNADEYRLLRDDWEELMEMIALGQIEQITARHGQVLQLRPKAANGRALTAATGQQGQQVLTRPRGFYLKKNFTRAILQRHFAL